MSRKLGNMDLKAIRDTIKSTGEVRFHILYSKSNLTVKCRLWHPDGHVLGVAHGGGYDRAGASLGQAIEKLFPEELKGLKPAMAFDAEGVGTRQEGGIYGLSRNRHGVMVLDGSCGIECMLTVLRALGFMRTDLFDTGKSSSMVLARKA